MGATPAAGSGRNNPSWGFLRARRGQNAQRPGCQRHGGSGSVVATLDPAVEAVLVALAGHLAILDRRVAVEPPELGVARGIGEGLALARSGAELFRFRHANLAKHI